MLIAVASPLVLFADERLVQVHEDTLTVRLSRVPVSDVVDQIAQQTSAQVEGEVQSPHDVTAAFEDLPLAEGLHRLLGDQSFSLVYGPRGELRRVKLLAGPKLTAQPGTSASAPVVVAPPPPPPSPQPQNTNPQGGFGVRSPSGFGGDPH
jgi:hypothetical protein